MSGSRTAMPPGQTENRELVYCYECENEWYRDQHGLTCPQCRSDFVQILENDESDPRTERNQGFNDFDIDDDDDDDHLHHHHQQHEQHHNQHNPHGITLRMGGENGPQISFQTLRSDFGSSPSPFGSRGPALGSFGTNPRSPFGSSAFERPSPPARSHEPSPLQEGPRRSPGATSNWGNGGGPIADMFTSIIQNIVGQNAAAAQQRSGQSPSPHPPFGEGRNPGEHPNPPMPMPGSFDQPEGPARSNAGTPMGGGPPHPPNPFMMNFGRGRGGGGGGVTYYSSTRTWTGPNGEVRTIRTSSPMPNSPMPGTQGSPGAQGGPQGPEGGPLNIADILANIIGAGAQDQDNPHGLPPFLRAFGLGHAPTGDYAWSNQDMDRILSQLMEQHQGNAPPPASEDHIKNLPKTKVTQAEVDDGNECVVCQDEFTLDEQVVKLPCKHIYHEECVKRWLESHDACPICRTPITPESERRQRPTPGAPPGGGPAQQPGGSGPSFGGGNPHTTSGSGENNGARWTWSASFGHS